MLPSGESLGRAGDHHAAVAVPAEHRARQFLFVHEAGHVRDVGMEADPGCRQMAPSAETAQGRREHPVTVGAQPFGDATENVVAGRMPEAIVHALEAV